MTPPHPRETPCDGVRPLLPALLDGAPERPADRAVRAHVAGCPSCGAVLAQHERLRGTLAGLARAAEAPPALRARVEAMLAEWRSAVVTGGDGAPVELAR